MARELLITNLNMTFLAEADAPADPPSAAAVITDGIDLIGVANGEALVPESVQGFSVTPSQIDVPDYITLQTGKIAGPLTIDDTTLEFYRDSATNAIYDDATMAEGLTGYIVIGLGSITPTSGQACSTWPVTIQSKDIKFTGSNEAAKWVLNLAMGVPTKDQTMAV